MKMQTTKILLSSVVITLLLLSSAVGEISDTINGKTISVEMKKGWNLLPNYMSASLGEPGWSIPGVPKETVDAVFLLNAETKEYSPAIKSYRGEGFVKTLLNGKEVEFVPEEIDFFELVMPVYPAYDETFFSNYLVSGMWVHTTADTTAEITFPKEDDFLQLFTEIGNKFGGAQLYKGWNFLALTPDMANVKLNGIKGDCNITRIVRWETESQSWKEVELPYFFNEYFEQDGIGVVITVKVANDCRSFGSLAGQAGIAAPELPK